MKNVTFYLGPTTGLSARQLTITRNHRASDGTSAPAAQYDSDVGAVDNVTVALPDNVIWAAVLVDTKSTGEESTPQRLGFHTGSLQFPGPSHQDKHFYILSMEDLSSSSSSSESASSESSSSSVSTSSHSSSSPSSSSISSLSSSSPSSSSSSSISTSSSSESSSSVSTSSVSSSSSSASSSSEGG